MSLISEVTDATQPTSMVSVTPLPTGPLLRWKACSSSVSRSLLTLVFTWLLLSQELVPGCVKGQGRTLPVPVTYLLQVIRFSNLELLQTSPTNSLLFGGQAHGTLGGMGVLQEKQCSFWAMFFCSPILELGLWRLLDKEDQTFEHSHCTY